MIKDSENGKLAGGKSKRTLLFLLLFACLVSLFFGLFPMQKGGRYALKAEAYGGDVMRIDEYVVVADVHENRSIQIQEKVVMTALQAGSKFTRYLPLEGDKYSQIEASCVDVEGFSYSVDVDDESEYLCVECKLPQKIGRGETRVFEFAYVMEIGTNDVENGMRLDIIGYGWSVPLHQVRAEITFPVSIAASDYVLYSGGYGAQGNAAGVKSTLSPDGKTLSLSADVLSLQYNDVYGESMAEGVTVEFTLPDKALAPYTKTRLFTKNLWKIGVGALVGIALVLAVRFFTRKKREIVPIVSVSAPDNADPLLIGKLLDGVVDKEDITSMLYYFADKGYLLICLEDEENPTLVRRVVQLPEDAPVYQRTLFEGLFKKGESVRVSELKNSFYKYVEKATKQVPPVNMYEKKSVFGYLASGILSVLFTLLSYFLLSGNVGGGYRSFIGFVYFFPVLALLIVGYIRENYRYKWKRGMYAFTWGIELVVAGLFTLAATFLFGEHFSTEYERLILSVCAFLMVFLAHGVVSRTDKYARQLGEILGFKEFITVTEEDKIKAMLEENPELYYHILPYAQVLGVTNEWEEKFKNIVVSPPNWYVGSRMTVFDYLLLNRCMALSMRIAMTRPQSQGGSFVGRSGGGGGFGGFGGGGHGGGGGGWS